MTKCKVISLSCVLRVYKPSIVHSDCLFSDSTAPPSATLPSGHRRTGHCDPLGRYGLTFRQSSLYFTTLPARGTSIVEGGGEKSMKFYRTVIIGRLIPLKWDIFIVSLPFTVLFSLFDTKNKIQETYGKLLIKIGLYLCNREFDVSVRFLCKTSY